MKRMIRNISLLLLALLFVVSCKRKPLSDDCLCVSTIAIPISVDWSTSGVDVQNVTLLVYNADDGSLFYEHWFEHSTDAIQSYVSLPVGSYTAVVFNELRKSGQIDYVTCVDHENISTLKFESFDATPLRSRADTRAYVQEPGDLALSIVEDIVITDDMILEAAEIAALANGTKSLSTSTRTAVESLTGIVPLKKNTTITITAYVKNIYYALMPALVDITNLADGYYVYGDQNSTTPSTLQVAMYKAYAVDFFDGTISATMSTFGTLGDRSSTSEHDSDTPIEVDALFKLVDNTTEESLYMDVTQYVTHSEQADGSYHITIDFAFDGELSVVQPSDSGGDSGFGSSLEDWEEGESVDLNN
ncbi:MAG: DUF5119 domain-containing protein [Rikenellaceae bacterium]